MISCFGVQSTTAHHFQQNFHGKSLHFEAFDGPYGKALAAYVVTPPATDWAEATESPETRSNNEEIVNVNSWGAVYDEMYKELGGGLGGF